MRALLLFILASTATPGLAQDYSPVARDTAEALKKQSFRILDGGSTLIAPACEPSSEETAQIKKLVALEKKCVFQKDLDACTALCQIKTPSSLLFDLAIDRATDAESLPHLDDVCHGRMEILSESLDRMSCDRTKRPFKSSSELKTYFNRIKDVYPFKMKDAKDLCRQRAAVLSARLFRDGFRARMIHMAGSGRPFRKTLNGQPFGFADHYAVEVKTESGDAYILDPQFEAAPLKKADYLRGLSEDQNDPVKELGFMERSSLDTQNRNTTVFRTFNFMASEQLVQENRLLAPQLREVGCADLLEKLERATWSEIKNR